MPPPSGTVSAACGVIFRLLIFRYLIFQRLKGLGSRLLVIFIRGGNNGGRRGFIRTPQRGGHFRFNFAGRKIEGETGAIARHAVNEDESPRLLDDAVSCRKPEPGALAGALGGVKRFENLVDLVGRDTHALIGNLHDDIIPRRHRGTIALQRLAQGGIEGFDADFPALGHGIAGIYHEIHQHLLELALVGPDRMQARIVGKRKRDLLPHQTIEQMGEIGKRLAQIQHLGAQVLLAGKGEQLTDETGRPIGILMDLHQIGIIHVVLIVAQQKEIAVAGNRCQQIVEIMRHSPGKLADRLHLLALHELRFQRLQFGRIRQDGNQNRLAILDHPAEAELQEDLLLGALRLKNLAAAEPAPRGRFAQPFADRPAEALHEIGEVYVSLPLPFVVIEKPAGPLVGEQHLTARRDLQERHRQLIEKLPAAIMRKLPLARRQEIDLPPPAGTLELGNKRAQRAFRRGDHVFLAVFHGQFVEHPIKRLHPSAHERAHGFVHEEDGA